MSKHQKADQASINIFDLIDSICAEFRQMWKAGKRPRIEEYLEQVPRDAKATLFRNLITLEIRYRQAAKESLTSNEYKRRFPEFSQVPIVILIA